MSFWHGVALAFIGAAVAVVLLAIWRRVAERREVPRRKRRRDMSRQDAGGATPYAATCGDASGPTTRDRADDPSGASGSSDDLVSSDGGGGDGGGGGGD